MKQALPTSIFILWVTGWTLPGNCPLTAGSADVDGETGKLSERWLNKGALSSDLGLDMIGFRYWPQKSTQYHNELSTINQFAVLNCLGTAFVRNAI